MKRIILTGGGSGGHAMPAVAVALLLREYEKMSGNRIKILYVGSKLGIEKKIAAKNHCSFVSVSTGKLRRYFSFENFQDFFRVIKGIFDSLTVIRRFHPDLIFSTGGFVSVPVVIAGRWKHVPSIIHEQTVDAGLANKIAGKFAQKIALTFPESAVYFPPAKTEVTGIPLRESIFHIDKEKAISQLGLDRNVPVLYVSGGGLGCHVLNETMLEILPNLLPEMNVILQTGNANDGKDYLDLLRFRENLEDREKQHLFVFNFIEDVGSVFAVSDLVVARSGAGTVNELIALKLPAIFIPLPIATGNEQFKNASIMKKMGGAEIIEEKDLTPQILLGNIQTLILENKFPDLENKLSNQENKLSNQGKEFLGQKNKLLEMKSNLKNVKNFRGNEKILELILQMLNIKSKEKQK